MTEPIFTDEELKKLFEKTFDRYSDREIAIMVSTALTVRDAVEKKVINYILEYTEYSDN